MMIKGAFTVERTTMDGGMRHVILLRMGMVQV